jgi:hypothetical protein
MAIVVVIGVAFAAGVVALADGISDPRTVVGLKVIIGALGVVLAVLMVAALVDVVRRRAK